MFQLVLIAGKVLLLASRSPGGGGGATPLLRAHVGHGLRKGPPVAGEVGGDVLSLAVGMGLRRTDDACSCRAGPLVVVVDILDADHHRGGDCVRVGRTPTMALISHDEGAVAEPQLGAVVTDPDVLDEPEG